MSCCSAVAALVVGSAVSAAIRASAPFFFFNDTATTEIYTLSLHDALPISDRARSRAADGPDGRGDRPGRLRSEEHTSELQSPYVISYAVFCLTKKDRP